MKKPFLPLTPCALLVSCFIAGAAHAQSINFSGDTNPSGNVGDSYNTTDVVVGNTSTGSLEILSRAWLGNIGKASIGVAAGSSGTATLSGNGAEWSAREFSVGLAGSGVLNIKSGSLTTSTGYIGRQAGSSGTVTIESGGSWAIPMLTQGDLWIGSNGGSATLNILSGSFAATTGNIFTATDAGSVVQVQVDGAGSRLDAAESCAFGMASPTTMQVTNGGSMECMQPSYLALGSVSLTGAGSRWVLADSLDIGYISDTSNAVLTIGEGSTVAVGSNLRVPRADSASAKPAGIIHIEGTSTPGALAAASLEFGANSLGVVNFNHSDASGNYQFATPVSGPGTVNVSNSGTTVLTGNNVYSGTTTVDAGVLRAGADTGLSRASDFVVNRNGTLDINTYSPTLATLNNSGTVTMLSGSTSSILTVAGNYVGNGGSIELNTALGDSTSATEKLIVNGDTSGTTILNITNLGGTGAPTSGQGILLVQVNGTSNGTFALPAPGYVEAGTFRYDLVKTGNNWYLQSEARAEVTGPEISVSCSPSELTAPNQVATCTVSLSGASASDLSVNLNLPATNARYTTTCTSPIVVPANATQASCTITSVGNGANATAELSIAAPSTPDAYSAGGAPSLVLIKDGSGGGDSGGGDNGGGDNGNGGGATPHKVPTMGALGLMSMASILGLIGLRRTRKSR